MCLIYLVVTSPKSLGTFTFIWTSLSRDLVGGVRIVIDVGITSFGIFAQRELLVFISIAEHI